MISSVESSTSSPLPLRPKYGSGATRRASARLCGSAEKTRSRSASVLAVRTCNSFPPSVCKACRTLARYDQQGHSPSRRHQFLQQLKAFRPQFSEVQTNPCDVAAGPADAVPDNVWLLFLPPYSYAALRSWMFSISPAPAALAKRSSKAVSSPGVMFSRLRPPTGFCSSALSPPWS
jgi:hypothetical protein